MKIIDYKCEEFISQLASSAPVPGGGGASALVGSIGLALGSMVGNLTTGKKKYAEVEDDIQRLLRDSEKLIKELNTLVERDAEVFEPLSKAYGMPKETEEERQEKDRVLQEALKEATLVPMQIAEKCRDAIFILKEFADKGSRLVLSDAGVGVVFCKAALQGAKLNVLINLKLMKDEAMKKDISQRLEKIENESLELADKVYEYVEECLCC